MGLSLFKKSIVYTCFVKVNCIELLNVHIGGLFRKQHKLDNKSWVDTEVLDYV